MSFGDEEALLAPALDWIARLPLLGERELAALLGIHEQDARAVRHALERRGWVDWIIPGAPGIDQRRFAYLHEAVVPALAGATGMPMERFAGCLPVRRVDVLDRITRAEITTGVNRLLTRIADSTRRAGHAELVDARSLPMAGAAADRWWPPGIEGYGCLRSGQSWAPFFVAWDRVGAPDVHRRARVLRWAAAAATASRAWGTERLPAILVVAAGEHELDVWEEALRRADGELAADVLLCTARKALRARPDAPVWRAPGTDRAKALAAALGWGAAPPVSPPRLPDGYDPPSLGRTGESLREWAPRAAVLGSRSWRERTAALALATDAGEKRLLEWVAFHPLLTAAELAVLVSDTEAPVQRRLDWLVRCGAVRTGGDPSARADDQRCYLLGDRGLRLLAARAGVPRARYARHGGVTVDLGDACNAPPVRHVEHTRGVNRTFERLAQDARRAGGRLAEWRGEATSTRRFKHDERTWFIRPDGSGTLELDDQRVPFLLEYDRGTLDAGDFAGKFEGYRRYFAAGVWERDFDAEPVLLFVCSDDRAERRVARAASACGLDAPIALTTEWRLRRADWTDGMPVGAIWRHPRSTVRNRLEPNQSSEAAVSGPAKGRGTE